MDELNMTYDSAESTLDSTSCGGQCLCPDVKQIRVPYKEFAQGEEFFKETLLDIENLLGDNYALFEPLIKEIIDKEMKKNEADMAKGEPDKREYSWFYSSIVDSIVEITPFSYSYKREKKQITPKSIKQNLRSLRQENKWEKNRIKKCKENIATRKKLVEIYKQLLAKLSA